ncbi:LPS export ABC transporter periplasmic protein LptC [Fuchsiella alkaliacetigena]|uniref:LPS export ABC transporter periplasmic protein LptC n=1 Tax=Fuchsiella alkaliacetigena TaxID=957042 RepID=UPI002009EC08|nr:LPS export ABC transporter periplasmic protein LptC [Fuchsiella alkaliacetigena]MCK8825650.1 LPS export ABC transporter periplasmic protein LptC [Fuchsiella alkaliacetigena]
MKLKKAVVYLIVLSCFFLVWTGWLAATETELETQASEAVHIRAGYLRQVDDLVELKEGVTIIRGDNEITAEWAELFRDEDKAVLYDGVKLVHSEGEIVGEQLTIFLEDEEYIFENQVELWQRDGEDDEDELYLQTSYLELFGEDNSFWTDQGVVIEYDRRLVTGDIADYDGTKRELELLENVHLEEEDGDWIKGPRAVFYFGDEKGFIMDGGIKMEIRLSD